MTRRVTVETRLKCVTREQEIVQTVQTDGRETPAMVRCTDLKQTTLRYCCWVQMIIW